MAQIQKVSLDEKMQEYFRLAENFIQFDEIQRSVVVSGMIKACGDATTWSLFKHLVKSREEFDRLAQLPLAVSLLVQCPEPTSEFPSLHSTEPLQVTVGPFNMSTKK